MQRTLLELQTEQTVIAPNMFLVEGNFEPSNFSLKAWMEKVADNLSCSGFKRDKNTGRVVEVTFRW